MKNLGLFGMTSALQLIFMVLALLVASHYNTGNTDLESLWTTLLIVSVVLGSAFMALMGSRSDMFVIALSPLLSSVILTNHGHSLSAALPNVFVYGIVVMSIWVGIAVAMKFVFEAIKWAKS